MRNYTSVEMVNKTVEFMLSQSKITLIKLNADITKVRRYQSQYDIGSDRYNFWKAVGDKLLRLRFEMEIKSQPSEHKIPVLPPEKFLSIAEFKARWGRK